MDSAYDDDTNDNERFDYSSGEAICEQTYRYDRFGNFINATKRVRQSAIGERISETMFQYDLKGVRIEPADLASFEADGDDWQDQ